MEKIALIKGPSTYSNWYKVPCLGISYIAACVEQKGFDCEIFDAYFNGCSEKEIIRHVQSYKPDIVGITAKTHEIAQCANIALLIKKTINVPVIVGGPHVTALPKKTLSEFPGFDYGICGEGEKTILELLDYLYSNKAQSDLRLIKGLVFREGENIIINEPRPYLTPLELNNLPFPAYHFYFGNNKQALARKNRYYSMISGRGCPYNCVFCMQVLGRKVRRRSAENICQEIEFAISSYGAHTIAFEDDIFLIDDKLTREILHLFIETGLSKRIRWTAMCRTDMVNSEITALAKQAGCFHLGMGVESGDDQILKVIGKGITVDQVKEAVKIIKGTKISLGSFFILGHPNETKKTIQKTIDLATELNTDSIAVGIMTPYPGTKIYDMAKRGEGGYRLISENWADYDKYGGKALEIEDLPYEELVKYQIRAYLNLYLKNFRLIDPLIFLWERKHGLYYFLKRKLSRLLKK